MSECFDDTDAKVYAPASGAYVVLRWEKTAPTPVGAGGYKGVRCTLSRATRYRMFKKLALRDWGNRPYMVTLTSHKVLDALTCSSVANYLSRKWATKEQGHCIRIEFQRRKSAHLHIILPSNVSRETLIDLKREWLDLIMEAGDEHTQKYGFHVCRPKRLDTKKILLYVGGHTIKGDYQSVSPYPLRQWFWSRLDTLPLLRDTGVIVSNEQLDKFRLKYTENRPQSFGGTLVLDITEIVK